MRATSHFRNFTGNSEIFHNSVKFESIFEISLLCSLELNDLQLLPRSTTRYTENFEIECFVYGIRNTACNQYRIFRFSDFRF
jgi:hypothetical protein